MQGTESFFRWISRISEYQNFRVIVAIDSNDQEIVSRISRLNCPNISVKVKNVNSPGLARNLALPDLDSDYVMFVDSDDYIYLEAINQLLKTTRTHAAIIASYEKFDVKTNKTDKYKCPVTTMEFAAEPALWRIIFKVSEIKGMSFTEFRMAEDQIFLMEYFTTQKKVISVGIIIYRYSINGNEQISKAQNSSLELQRALNYLEANPTLRKSKFSSLVYAKLNLSVGIHRIKKLILMQYTATELIKLIVIVLNKKRNRSFDSSFELDWIVNG